MTPTPAVLPVRPSFPVRMTLPRHGSMLNVSFQTERLPISLTQVLVHTGGTVNTGLSVPRKQESGMGPHGEPTWEVATLGPSGGSLLQERRQEAGADSCVGQTGKASRAPCPSPRPCNDMLAEVAFCNQHSSVKVLPYTHFADNKSTSSRGQVTAQGPKATQQQHQGSCHLFDAAWAPAQAQDRSSQGPSQRTVAGCGPSLCALPCHF